MEQVGHESLPKVQVRRGLQRLSHLQTIQCSISLRSGSLDGRPTRAIKQTELDTGAIDHSTHNSAKSINLAHEMSLTDAADGWIAGHLSNKIEIESDDCRLGTDSGRGRSRFTAGVASADYHYIEVFVEDHSSRRCDG